ncbi:Protein of unknown function [Bacillus cytotoxicus]|uniref:Uncharacterized protein n=1 Tax=Bacillus cytotoxicus TaxID=580165 RepID=A0AAX2CJ37_9BACI|nr:Protein of unknown function [Bacillus cytotoxicus]SCN38157.1 Protein of unknown function [Bacillus cytotoxicus]
MSVGISQHLCATIHVERIQAWLLAA